MSKDLPYFKFIASEWLTGNICFEPFESQGLFINICALYWNRGGVLKLSEIEQRYKKKSIIAKLSDRFFSLSDGYIQIEFLDEQLSERERLSKQNAMNGQKGGFSKSKKNVANAKRTPSETLAKPSNIEKEKEEEQEKSKNKKKIEEVLIFPFDSDRFKSFWKIWKDYKKQNHKFSYKGILSEQASLKELSELSEGNEEIALKIIEQSISKGWKGLFKLNNNGSQQKSSDAPNWGELYKKYSESSSG